MSFPDHPCARLSMDGAVFRLIQEEIENSTTLGGICIVIDSYDRSWVDSMYMYIMELYPFFGLTLNDVDDMNRFIRTNRQSFITIGIDEKTKTELWGLKYRIYFLRSKSSSIHPMIKTDRFELFHQSDIDPRDPRETADWSPPDMT